jgi:glycosyltransferase involved in cell wall biosynthesis
MISVLILTRNEDRNLPICLSSVKWCDDIHVLDSMSTDNTVAIATTAGANVTQREFDNWSSHQNWALQNLPFRHPWVFYLDADELATPELRDAMLQAVAAPGNTVAFRIERRDYFRGTWLKHVQASPFYLRLFRPGKMRYERLVNPISIPDGPIGQLTGYIDHFPFSKGIGDWIARHNQYSELEAKEILASRRKKTSVRLYARPLARFFALYVIKRGFLDGRAGLTYATLQAVYEYMLVLKIRELERAGIRCNC